MRTLLVHALRSEAGYLRQHFPQAAGPVCDLGIELRILNEHFHLMRTGMGLQATEIAMKKVPNPEQYDRLLHFGVSGAISNDLTYQTLIQGVEFKAEGERSINPPLSALPQDQTIPQLTFYSAREPVVSDEGKARIQSFQAHAVDMESYAIASYTVQYAIPLLALRCISDQANHDVPEDFKRHYAAAAKKLQNYLLEHIIRV